MLRFLDPGSAYYGFVDHVRDMLNRRGWDLRVHRPFWELIVQHDYDLVVDVGANRGQFARHIRRLGYRNKIVSFEPQAAAFKELESSAAADPNWEVQRLAIGADATRESASMRVYAADDFSSFLEIKGDGPPLVGTEVVPMRTLDQAAGDAIASARRALLKVDTQGFEQQVLAGATRSLQHLEALILEVCLVPHYDGQWVIEEALAFCRAAGFTPLTMRRGYFAGDRNVEYDAFFVRSTAV
jgi:FkbM family methyltransferase